MTFEKFHAYYDAIGRQWKVTDRVNHVLLVACVNDNGMPAFPRYCLAVDEDGLRATVRLADGFTTIYADGDSTTPALDRAKDANYGPRDSNGCCWHCEHFRIQEYAPSGKKCVCDELNIQVLKGHGCRFFKWRKSE